MRYWNVSVVSVLVVLVGAAAAVAGPSASLEGDTLRIGNERVVWEFGWNKGNLITRSIKDVASGKTLVMAARKPDVQIGRLTGQAKTAEWSKREVKQSATVHRHLQVEVITRYASIELRRVFRVYSDSSMIGCDYYLRPTGDKAPDFSPAASVLLAMRPPGVHWTYRAVEFFDRTDQINTLVRETSVLAYQRPAKLRGNVLLARGVTGGGGLVVVKEAPCSFVQLHYGDHDFSCGTSGVKVVGLGVSPDDLSPKRWTRAYGVAIGVSDGSDLGALLALRSYQKSIRRHLPARDEMIMMNTWGDRNRDARIGEAFVKAQVDACRRLGVSHLQIDDGWQEGLSVNSASGGRLWDRWDEASWQPHAKRFPNGLAPVVKHAKTQGVELGLWFHPSNADDYAKWAEDARIVINLHRKFGVRYFKIDGVKLPTKASEINLRRLLDRVLAETKGQVVFNLDATADNRGGYHYFYEYGNIFLENRYTDFGRYYPHWTLRNLWMLSKYVPPEKLQIEFLNKWRNAQKYAPGDPLAPAAVPFDYQFAVTMMGQPLAWFEGSELPPQAFRIAPLVKTYRQHQADIHRGTILPIGAEPSGTSWTGFQSITAPAAGYLLVFREHNDAPRAELTLHGLAGKTLTCRHLAGHGKDAVIQVDQAGRASFALPKKHTFALYRYGTPNKR